MSSTSTTANSVHRAHLAETFQQRLGQLCLHLRRDETDSVQVLDVDPVFLIPEALLRGAAAPPAPSPDRPGSAIQSRQPSGKEPTMSDARFHNLKNRKRGSHSFMWGSSQSRSALPMRLITRVVTKIAEPGNVAIHHEFSM